MIAAVITLLMMSADGPDAGAQARATEARLEFWGGEVYREGRKLSREEAYRELGREDLVEDRERRELYRWIGFGSAIGVAAIGNVARTTGTVMGFMGEKEAKDKLFWGGLAAEVLLAPAIVGVTILIPAEPVSNEELKKMVEMTEALGE